MHRFAVRYKASSLAGQDVRVRYKTGSCMRSLAPVESTPSTGDHYTDLSRMSTVQELGPVPIDCMKIDIPRKLCVGSWIFSVCYILDQCCATFLHSRHTKYCRRVMAAHQPQFAYCEGGGDGLWH
jgi:hypothetical protein